MQAACAILELKKEENQGKGWPYLFFSSPWGTMKQTLLAQDFCCQDSSTVCQTALTNYAFIIPQESLFWKHFSPTHSDHQHPNLPKGMSFVLFSQSWMSWLQPYRCIAKTLVIQSRIKGQTGPSKHILKQKPHLLGLNTKNTLSLYA